MARDVLFALYLSGALLCWAWGFRVVCAALAHSLLPLAFGLLPPWLAGLIGFGLAGAILHGTGAAALVWPLLLIAAGMGAGSLRPERVGAALMGVRG
jgi:hypothetical protein